MNRKELFNQDSEEGFFEARIFTGNPTGVNNFNQTNHKWAATIYKNMRKRVWFPGQVDISKDKVNYNKLDDAERRGYDLALAQLIPNDSIQANQLVDNINPFITSPIVNCAIISQSLEEVVHSESYSIMAEDICEDTDRIYNMHKHDAELRRKNEAVKNMYTSIYDGNTPILEDLFMVAVANQVLEELVFPGGFVLFYTLEKNMIGTAEMISEINKDESLSHVPLFMNIFRTGIIEEYNGVVPDSIVEKAHKLIIKLTDAEKRWTKYMTKGIMGFSDNIIDVFVEGQANSVCKNLGIPLLYDKHANNPLQDILSKHISGGEHKKRGGFFERNVAEYSKGGLVIDF